MNTQKTQKREKPSKTYRHAGLPETMLRGSPAELWTAERKEEKPTGQNVTAEQGPL